jgi:hypothetical protein
MGFDPTPWAQPDEDYWEIVAAGDQGDELWRPRFGTLEDVVRIFEAIDAEALEVSVAALVEGLPYFEGLAGLEPAEIARAEGFEANLDGFLSFRDDPEHDEYPGGSFNAVRLYVERSRADAIIREFDRLLRRLSSDPTLQAAGIVGTPAEG